MKRFVCVQRGFERLNRKAQHRTSRSCERITVISLYIEAEGVSGAITLNQSRRAWATELGLTHEAMYRTLRRLQAEGVLDIDRKQIAMGRQRNVGRSR